MQPKATDNHDDDQSRVRREDFGAGAKETHGAWLREGDRGRRDDEHLRCIQSRHAVTEHDRSTRHGEEAARDEPQTHAVPRLVALGAIVLLGTKRGTGWGWGVRGVRLARLSWGANGGTVGGDEAGGLAGWAHTEA